MTVCDAVAHICLTLFAVIDPVYFCIVPNMMSMLNQAAVEALCSATYLENYLDCTENLPDDLQRIVTHLRELDFQTNGLYYDTPKCFDPKISTLCYIITRMGMGVRFSGLFCHNVVQICSTENKQMIAVRTNTAPLQLDQ